MSAAALFWPALAEVVLILVLAASMGVLRSRAISSGAVKLKDIAVGQQAWPGVVQRVSSCYSNQFETPVLFFAGLAFAAALGVHDAATLGLAWLFVASRLVHALIYVTVNVVLWRFLVFVAGFAALAGLWLRLAAHVAGVA